MTHADSDQTRASRVLVVLAHPDDPEFFCGGTVARWAQEGRHIVYCLLTRGDKGADEPGVDPADLAQTREAEQRAAARVLGVAQVIFLDYRDGELTVDRDLRRDVVRVVRQVRPDVLITSDPSNYYGSFVNHSDHRAAGQAALDAVWPGARSALYYPELYQDEGLEPHKVREVWIAGAVHPDTVVDITDSYSRKLKALEAHQSQIKDINALDERLRKRYLDPESPPDAPRYVERFKRIELS
ncbi:MAG TPA: PIG-L deacetylase family protein [Anaerolineales bacterium]